MNLTFEIDRFGLFVRVGGFNRGGYFRETQFRGSPSRFATKISSHLPLDVTGSFTCAAMFVEKSYFSEILIRMRSREHPPTTSSELDLIASSILADFFLKSAFNETYYTF